MKTKRAAGNHKLPKALLLTALWLWGSATGILLLVAPTAAYLLHKQYTGLANRTAKLVNLVETFDYTKTTQPYIDEGRKIAENITNIYESIPPSLFAVSAAAYITVALLSALLFWGIAAKILKGSNWMKIAATVLAAITIILVLSLWSFIAPLSWIPVNAIQVNNAGLLISALYLLGAVILFLPPVSQYMKIVRDEHRAINETNSGNNEELI